MKTVLAAAMLVVLPVACPAATSDHASLLVLSHEFALAPGDVSPAPNPDRGDEAAEPPTPEPQELPDGAETYRARCAPCHAEDGRGIEGQIPPLRNSDYLKQDLRRAIRGVLRGLEGEITVNGKIYRGAMPAQSWIPDVEIAAALTHVLGWSGDVEPVSAELVAEVRRDTADVVEVKGCSCGGRCMAAGMAQPACKMGASGGCGSSVGGCACKQGAARRHRHGRGW